ncbi:hypothetical protein [Paenibacillus vini]|uniref:Pre-toxin TG domain-containing protein n=1 Tax=Paenibacillus vini TaxID=1476024 RepID=A0ABQ4MFM4_9BACL|nr:hypothetical protein [Paenibacillus vini]GIP54758.1 hypothetical protein J42TS3_37930 [Paenibacillus vini]
MAFDLVAKLKLQDNFSDKMRKVTKMTERAVKATDSYTDANGRLRNAQGKFVSSGKSATKQMSALERMMQRASRSANTFGKNASNAMNRAARGTGGLVRGIGAVATAYLGAKAAAGLFDKTIGAAAQYEMREVTVKAMFGGNFTKNAQKYLDFVEGRAAVSQFSMDDFLTAGKSFIPTTKDNAQLAKMINLAERLGAIDPDQGLTGAAFALKEFFSGDAVSLVERFELPRKVMNDLKDLPLEKQLKELDKYFDKIGATNELIEAQAATGMGEWRRATAKMTRALREMGTQGLEKIKPLLRDFNKWLESPSFQKFKEAGTKAFAEVFQGASNMVRKATDYINTHFLDNPEFKKLETFESKVKFVLSDLAPVLSDGMKFGGELASKMISGMIPSMTKGILDNPVLATTLGVAALIASPTPIGLTVALSVTAPAWFKALVEGVSPTIQGREEFNREYNAWQKGVEEASKPDYKVPGVEEGWAFVAPEPKTWGKNAWEGFSGGFNSIRDWIKHPTQLDLSGVQGSQSSVNEEARKYLYIGGAKKPNGHAGGLDRVPYNGYTARLHRDETVLTRTEAQEYRENQSGTGKGSRGDGPLIHIANLTVRNDSDIDRIARELAGLLAG